MKTVTVRNVDGDIFELPAGPDSIVYLNKGEEVVANPYGLALHHASERVYLHSLSKVILFVGLGSALLLLLVLYVI